MSRLARLTPAVLVVLTVAGLANLAFGVAGLDPLDRPVTVSVELDRSGGLYDGAQLTYRGVPVGRVTDVRPRAGGVEAVARIDGDVAVPRDTEAVVAALSGAGEQYLDLRPRTDGGPSLADGDRITAADTRTPIPFQQVLANGVTLADQADPEAVGAVVDELHRAFGNGADADLARILDGGEVLLGGLEQALPATVRTLSQGRTVLGTVDDLSGVVLGIGDDARSLTGQVRAADPDLRRFLEQAPDALATIDRVVREDGPSAGALLGDLVGPFEVLSGRTPALSEFLPGLAGLGPAASRIVQDGRFAVLVDLYPRPTCDYGTQRRPPTIGGSPPPQINRYCGTTGPRLQQRGAANVPRPPGDDTAGPAPGADPAARARAPR